MWMVHGGDYGNWAKCLFYLFYFNLFVIFLAKRARQLQLARETHWFWFMESCPILWSLSHVFVFCFGFVYSCAGKLCTRAICLRNIFVLIYIFLSLALHSFGSGRLRFYYSFHSTTHQHQHQLIIYLLCLTFLDFLI